MPSSLSDLDTRYKKLLGMQSRQKKVAESLASELEKTKDQVVLYTQALEVITSLADEARQNFKIEVDRLVTLAIKSVFSENFGFDLQMTIKNNRLQCLPTITETVDGETTTYTPKDDMGGSILDSIGFAFRILLQKFGREKTRKILLLDEPMKNTGHGELLTKAGGMLTELSKSLGLQLILITHDQELAEIGDRVWQVTRTKDRSSAVLTHPAIPNKPKRKLIK